MASSTTSATALTGVMVAWSSARTVGSAGTRAGNCITPQASSGMAKRIQLDEGQTGPNRRNRAGVLGSANNASAAAKTLVDA